MANQNQNSFIPKGSFTQGHSRMESSIGLVNLIAFVILGSVLFFSALVFLYHYWLVGQLNRPCDVEPGCGLVEAFERESRNLDVSAVSRLVTLDFKMRSARSIINNHVTLVPLLNLLEEYTLHNVRFTSLEFSRPGDLRMAGVARSYEDIAIQSRAFRSSGHVNRVAFSGFSTDDAGNVRFNITLGLDESLLKYQSNRN